MALPLGRNSGQENAICYAIQERAICENPDAGPDGVGVRSDDCAYTMEARTVPQAVAYQAIGFAQNQRDEVRLMDVSGALAAEPGMKQTTYVAQPAVHVSPTLRAGGNSTGGDRPPGTDVDTVDSLITTFIDNIVMLVRRLMPVECERLQGFPDEWTRIPIKHYAVRKLTKNRPEDMWIADPNGGWWLTASDGPRYKQLGNSMAVAVMNWIGRRVQMQLIVTDFEDILG